MDFREMGFEDVDLIHVAQNRGRCRAFLSTVTNLRAP